MKISLTLGYNNFIELKAGKWYIALTASLFSINFVFAFGTDKKNKESDND